MPIGNMLELAGGQKRLAKHPWLATARNCRPHESETMVPEAPDQNLDQAQKPLEIDEDELDEDELDEMSGAGFPEFRRRSMQPDGGGHGCYH